MVRRTTTRYLSYIASRSYPSRVTASERPWRQISRPNRSLCRPTGDCCTNTCTPVSLAELASNRVTTADDCVSEEVGDGFCDFELNNEVRTTALQ